MPARHGTVDEYLAAVASPEFRAALQHLREVIRGAAPDAEECISYGVPGYKQHGYMCGFAAFKNHCSFFPGGIVPEFADELQGFKVSKGTIQFKPSEPLSDALVTKIVSTRLAELLAKKKK